MQREAAETLALKALEWILGQEDLAGVFLGATGADPDGLAAAAQHPDTLLAVLDFLMMDDAWVMGFAAWAGVAPEFPAAARHALPGGGAVNWT